METRFCVGSKVRMKENVAHIALPEFYPDCTVIGEVVATGDTKMVLVNWGEDSGTSGNHTWLVEKSFIVKVEE
nr:MAG TPA: hypothetical protein [Caudoviricetes sp.]